MPLPQRPPRRRAAQACAGLLLVGQLFVAAGAPAQPKKASFGVRARLLSGWEQTPAAAQSLEWLRDVDGRLAGSLLLEVASSGTLAETGADLSGGLPRFEAMMQSASARTFHELLVRNHYYSPRIEMLRSLERRDRATFGRGCTARSAWAVVWPAGAASPAAACDGAALRRTLAADVVPAGDAAQPAGGAGPLVRPKAELTLRGGDAAGIVVVYGALQPESFSGLAELLTVVNSLPADTPWRVVFRHADGPLLNNASSADALTGYGFELAIKSSEYKTHAEEKSDGQKAEEPEAAEESDGDEEARVQREELSDLDDLETENDTDTLLKDSEIKDIGLQATARILSSSAPLLQLMQLSQDFPAKVVGLAGTTVPDTVRKGAHKLRRLIQEGSEVFSLNGRLVRPDHSDLSLFPLVAKLLPFFVGVERLVQAGVDERLACELLQESQGQPLPERLDWRSAALPPPLYDVTKDSKASRWSSNLQALMYSFMGGLAPMRLPLYSVIFAFDPAEVADLKVAHQLLANTPLPMALRFVLLPRGGGSAAARPVWDEAALGRPPSWLKDAPLAGDSLVGGLDASTAIAVAYCQLLTALPAKKDGGAAGSPASARAFLRALSEWAVAGASEGADQAGAGGEDARIASGPEAIAEVRALWAKQQPDAAGVDTAWETAVATFREKRGCLSNWTSYVTSLGIPLPAALVNGRLLLKGAYDGQQSIYPAIALEQQVLQRALYMGKLADATELDGFMESQGLLAAFHPDITPDLAQRGGEDGTPGRDTTLSYTQWPGAAFMAVDFLRSSELPAETPAETAEEGGPAAEPKPPLNFFHLLVLKGLAQVYLLRVFAEHLLHPDRSALTSNKQLVLPPFSSSWSVIVDARGDEALLALAGCVRGALKPPAAEDAEAAGRQRLQLLKFLGSALPAVAAAAADGRPTAAQVNEICELAISKKLDPDAHAKVRAAVQAARGSGAAALEGALLATAAPALQGRPGAALWVCNGRQVVLEASGQPVSASHVQALELMEAQYDVGAAAPVVAGPGEQEEAQDGQTPAAPQKVKSLSEWLQGNREALPDKLQSLVAAIRTEALSYGLAERYTQPVKIFEAAPAAMRLTLPPARPDAASPIKVYGILDPLSGTAQSASAALALFGMAFNAEVNLVLNPALKTTEYPLKKYYREVIRWPARLADGRAVASLRGGGGLAEGSAEVSLSTKHTLTAAVHALPTWSVTAFEAVHDMDNLRLVDVGDGKWCETTYKLRQLYSEGQAFVLDADGWPVAPAKGLQIEVGRQGEESHDDTMVMGNLGYFQVRGDPGKYEVRLKTGLSNETFELSTTQDLEVSSYITPPYQLRVQLRANKSHQDLFEEGAEAKKLDGQPGGRESGPSGGALSQWMSRFGSMFGGGAAPQPPQDLAAAAQEAPAQSALPDSLSTIHIFSVASGHLYEKLLSIMILSVRNQTKSPLHFWFIDNFLSPKFKVFIPHLAEKYNFGFDFVTYKWPSWLNPQSEKQRLIWAYKVLFLDVLFPMGVPKVIFIDADQVVRADVRELWDMDLGGKVYGWVPMGDSNPETEGFKFWKQGYWKNHLGDLKYHIAALYVVDLVEYRRRSIGDALRGIYNQLSRDPNSLSNLEQDLVNFAQHNIPIFSLPDEWLWCETWCSQESKPQAKTIDLCQNPLTKEPKIVMAKRIIPEWQNYHDQVQRFQEQVEAAARASPAATAAARAGHTEL